jgi:hypothetical protein
MKAKYGIIIVKINRRSTEQVILRTIRAMARAEIPIAQIREFILEAEKVQDKSYVVALSLCRRWVTVI